MSETREHWNSTLLSVDGKMNVTLEPGDLVRNFYSHGDIGTVVEIIDENRSVVLWNKYHDPYSGALGGSRNYTSIARSLFSVEPMPQGALPFYLENMISEKKEEK